MSPHARGVEHHAKHELTRLLGGVCGRNVRTRTHTPGERVYLFAHETLRLVAEHSFGKSLTPYRDRLYHWADTYRQRGWPVDTPQYLLRSYPRLLASIGDLAGLVVCAADQTRHHRMRSLTGLERLAAAGDHLAERNANAPTTPPAV